MSAQRRHRAARAAPALLALVVSIGFSVGCSEGADAPDQGTTLSDRAGQRGSGQPAASRSAGGLGTPGEATPLANASSRAPASSPQEVPAAAFVETSVRRLREAGAPPAALDSVTRRYAEWRDRDVQAVSARAWLETVARIHELSEATGVESDVTVVTRRAGRTTAGARVRYILTADRRGGKEPAYTGGLTTVSESWSIGEYYVWSERGGEPTSDTTFRQLISEPRETIELEELPEP